MNTKKLYHLIETHQLPNYRAKQILQAVYQDGVSSFAEITTLPKNLREIFSQELPILSFEPQKILVSKDNKSIKALLKLSDNSLIETVLLSPKPGHWSACISSQVGCALGCRFCATGASGFKRNLTAEEITDQILFWKQYLKNNWELGIGNWKFSIVFMGMGEPFLNYDNVKSAIKTLTDPELFNLGDRHISVSTSGVVEGIKKFAKDFPQINLAISLIFASDAKRSEFMPINRKHDLSDLKKALDLYFDKNNRKVFLEYILFENLNDKKIDADKLIAFVQTCSRPDLLHINLIRYNLATQGLKPSAPTHADWFKNYLAKNQISATIRKSLGEEIQAACGQLAAK